MKVEMAVLGFPSPISLMVSVVVNNIELTDINTSSVHHMLDLLGWPSLKQRR